MIKDFEPRLYQQTILATAALKNTLVVLPTGMGKTNIFLMLTAQRLKQHPNSKIVLLGPTRPLIDQYKAVFEKYFEIERNKLITFTGQTKPEKRAEQWQEGTIFFSTPQGFENDLVSNRITLKDVSLIGFDEAHKAVGEYSYVWLAKRYMQTARYPRILGMTASPGSELEKIHEVCQNLHIEDVEVRNDQDPDVKPYIQDIDITWEIVEFPETLKKIHTYLHNCYTTKLQSIKEKGYLYATTGVSKKELLGVQSALHGELSRNMQDFNVMRAISLCAEALKVQHAVELLETQGLEPLQKYMNELQRQATTTKTKAILNLVKDINFRSALIKTDEAISKGIIHPKIERLKELLEKKVTPKDKIIIFNQYRDSAQVLLDLANSLPNIKAKLFVGQQKKGTTGMSQKDQIKMLEDFRNNEFNVIIMTSVGEEGLDIPRVDEVIFYEPIPSAIRHIQRRGRTGRQDKGKVTILMTKGTRDETYRWSAHHKEKRMHTILKKLKKEFHQNFTLKKQETLSNYTVKEQPTIYVDNREKGNDIAKQLLEMNAQVRLAQLESADYILSSRAGIEFKTVEDFVNSLVDGRLLTQAAQLVKNFEKPIILVQGETSIYGVRNIHPNAIRGLLASLAIDFRIPIIYTKDSKESAQMIFTLATRESESKKATYSLPTKKMQSYDEQMETIIAALPNIGMQTAQELLKHFKTVESIMTASEETLTQIDKIGPVSAKRIRDILTKKYEK
ncbi:MAG: DEAD/DEAH box helicase [Candidatus Woesearchaeota archaeon]